MAKKQAPADLVLEATMARNALTRSTGKSAKEQKARAALEKAMADAAAVLAAKREALTDAVK